MDTPDIKDLSPSRCREIYIKTNYNDFWKYLNENYAFLESFQERMYWYYHKLNKKPVCGNCKGPVRFVRFSTGYQEYCCKKCSNSSIKKIEDTKHTNNTKFGGNAPACSSVVQNKMQSTCIERYGVENAMQNSEIKKKTCDTHIERYGGQGNGSKVLLEKHKKTCLEKYGVKNGMQSNYIKTKVKQNNLCKYGVEHIAQLQSTKNIVIETKREHKTFNTSNIEEQFAQFLDSQCTQYIRQYSSELYPFNCDFYIPKYNLYIEINAMWTHNTHPYDKNSIEDALECKKWKSKKSAFYKNAIEVWTVSDPKKLAFAKKNRLNYLCSYSTKIEDLINEYNTKIDGNT